MKTSEIRTTFLEYFRSHGHEVVASGPVVPRNDPTLLFTSAGMVPFKNVFVGQENRDYTRAATSQKCLRAGGKHNDLENVGYTARHHTFFEMLGNFSFGDYFKDVAIERAWDLLTNGFGLPEEKLLVTVYAEDQDAAELWKKIAGLPDKKVLRIPTSDNFWAMGDTGPCGPCSEIFYDHGPGVPGGPPGSADEDGDRFIEVWNLVFMQYEQVAKDKRVDLPKPSIDTGMGLERLAAVLQGRHDNYDIDLMRSLIEASADVTGVSPDGEHAVSHRVIADHLRAASFLIAENITPSNEGRGYVLRRIMRRAMRHAHLMGAKDPVMWRLVPALVSEMGAAYAELGQAEAFITETLKTEEVLFKKTLARGLKLLGDESAKVSEGGALPGEIAFKLHDTYGFPLDLTQDVLRGEGKTVETAGFDAAMEEQRARARKSWAGSGEAATEQVWFDIKEKTGATDFLGYETVRAEGQVLALVVDGKPADAATAGQDVAVITNQTPFYGESGGQIGDRGGLFSAAGGEIRITDTQKKLGDLFVHFGQVGKGRLAVGDAVEMSVDSERRDAIRANHSATHLLHEALRRRLGTHVAQKGSLVAPDRLRFDISHPEAISRADVLAIEAEVNDRVRENAEVVTRLMTPDEAIAEGAMALFGEKYGEVVRVVSMGRDGNRFYSLELCGGTHVGRTGDIGGFKIVSEGAVAAGVRRIEALTGAGAVAHFAQLEDQLAAAAAAAKTTAAELPARITARDEEVRRLNRENADLRRKLASGGGAGAGTQVKEIGDVKFAGLVLDGVPPKDLKPMADDLKRQLGTGVTALIAVNDGKASIVVGVTEDLTDRFNAIELVRAGSTALSGKGGGGRPDMAQAGGPDGARAPDALAAIEAVLA